MFASIFAEEKQIDIKQFIWLISNTDVDVKKQLKVAQNSFQQLDFDVSLWPLLIT